MTSYEKDFESSNDIISRSIEIASFSFHNLPLLVQWKILRQYIPILCKAFVLHKIPEFSKLLSYEQSWMKPSEIFSILCSLKNGLYINLENFSRKAYYVSLDQRKITFTLCCLDKSVIDYKVCAISSECPINPFTSKSMIPITLPIFKKFLVTFLNNYTFSVNNVVKVYEFQGYFFVNYSTNKVCWNNGNFYDIANGLCNVRLSKFKWYQIILKDNYFIELRINSINHFCFENDKCGTLKTENLAPISLETYLLSKEKRVYEHKSICQINFHFITDDHVMLNVKADNPRMCLEYLNANLLDCLDCIKAIFNKYNIV